MASDGPPVDRSRAFRPTGNFTPVESLSERVLPLVTERRLRSALQPVLEVLSADPKNEHAFMLAITVLTPSISGHREAIEPIEDAQWNDARLDPIFAECSKCQKVSWVPHMYLLAASNNVNVLNAAGMQCYDCGYVLCRECVRAHQSILFSGRTDTEVAQVRCASCGSQSMSAVVYPTGRRTREMRDPNVRIRQIYLFRSGPVPPDVPYLQELLSRVCHQALEDQARLRVFPMFPWPESIQDVAVFYVLRMIHEGELPEGALANPLTGQFVDQDKNAVYLLAITEPRTSSYDEARRAIAERRFRDAVPLLESVIHDSPAWPIAYNDLGFARIHTGHLALAFEALERGRALRETPEILCNLGLAHFLAGSSGEAIEVLEKALAMQPDFANAKENLEAARGLHARRERRRKQWQLETAPPPANEWACYRGDPGHSASAPEGPSPPLGLRWQFKTDGIVDGSPAVAGHRVYFGTMKGVVHCLDAFSGREYWQASIGEEGVMSSPAVFADRVYLGTVDGELCCLDARSGAEQWRFAATDEVKSSPVATPHGIVVGSVDGKLYCIDDAGRERWRFEAGRPLLSSPAVLGQKLYLSAPEWLSCLSLDSGELLWRQPRGFDQGNILAVTPAATAAGVFIAGIETSGGETRGHVYCFDPEDGRQRWVYDWPSPDPGFQSSPAVAGRTVVIGGLDGVIVAIDDQRSRWLNTDLAQWWILASPAVGSGFVYLPVNDGRLHCLALGTGEHLWDMSIDAETHGASSSPALAYHRLYVGTSQNGMLCFGEMET